MWNSQLFNSVHYNSTPQLYSVTAKYLGQDQGNLRGNISRGRHIAIMYEGELLNLQIFLLLCTLSNFVQPVLLFLHAFSLSTGKHSATVSCTNCAK